MQPKILVIDPLPDLTEALAAVLHARGWEVQTARSLGEAILKTDVFEPHVVLAGVETPLEVGIAFGERLRALHDGNVFLTAMSASSPSDVKKHDPALFDLICHKPLTDDGIDVIEAEASRRFPSLSFDAP
jgi:DNA-binding response OmpR family regulator